MDEQMDRDGANAPKKDMAIAFEIQRKNKRKKMANGGPVSAKDESRPSTQELDNDKHDASEQNSAKPLASGFDKEPKASIDITPTSEEMEMLRNRRLKMAEGGWVDGHDRNADDQDMDMDLDMMDGSPSMSHELSADDSEESSPSIAQTIMRRKKYADGGMVDLDDNATEDGNDADEDNHNAYKKENYSEKSGLNDLDYDTSESDGDDLKDEDEHGESMIDSIRRKNKKK